MRNRRRARFTRRARRVIGSLGVCAAVFFAAFATAGAIDAMRFQDAKTESALRAALVALCVDAALDERRSSRVEERAFKLLDERRRARAAGLHKLLPALDAQAKRDLATVVEREVVEDVLALVARYTPL